LLKESTIEAAQLGFELTKNLQQLVASGEVMKDTAEGVQEENVGCSESDASEASRGNTDSLHTAKVIEIESSSTSISTYSTSSDLNDVSLGRIYSTISKGPSPYTKLQKKPDDDAFEPIYPSVLERIGEMAQMRINVNTRLPVDHPFQPLVIEPLQSIPADAEVVGGPA